MDGIERPKTRYVLLDAAITELAKVGSDVVETGLICRSLGVSPGLVKHYFGGRSGLILEAAITAYERYVEGQVSAVQSSGDEPQEQLRAWIAKQVEWTISHPGIASVLNFPKLHLPEGAELDLESRLRLERASSRNLIVLASILDRIQRGTKGIQELTREVVTKDFGLASATAYVGWLVYGHSLWRAGQHAPTVDLPEVRAFEAAVFDAFPRIAVQIAEGLSSHKS